jgi:aryl-alcohol dehydrogenase-like predicted oxidoreductase
VLGRVGGAASLRAMASAWDAGITLFDTARSYGYGNAEGVLGEFLKGRRGKAVIATKFGLAPETPGTLKRFAIPVARAVMRMPGLAKLKRGTVQREARSGQFSVQGLRTSLETSLRELRTDYVDLLFLHEATFEAIHHDELMAELGAVVQAGKVLRVGVYGGKEVVAEALKSGPSTLIAMQYGADFFDPQVARFAQDNVRGALLIGNHPFGSEQRIARLRAMLGQLAREEEMGAELREKLGDKGWQMLLEVIFAVVLNESGIHALVFSMMRADHLHANMLAIEKNRFTAAEAALIRGRLLGSVK